jgi:histidinol-phosphate phosphatase family protein
LQTVVFPMPAPVVFLDKDDTLIENIPYNVDPARIRLLPGAREGLKSLSSAGWRIAIASNQSGVARGFFPEEAIIGVEARLRELLTEFGVDLAGFFYCPHHPEGCVEPYAIPCDCRKPAPGLLVNAAKTLNADPNHCWMVGDSPTDVEAGHRAGCRTILLASNSKPPAVACAIRPDIVVADMEAAAAAILDYDSEQPDLLTPLDGR